MAILKVETDIIANIAASPIGRTEIFVIMSVEAFRADVIVFIGHVIMCFTSDLPSHCCPVYPSKHREHVNVAPVTVHLPGLQG
jgi:hypothetical protein